MDVLDRIRVYRFLSLALQDPHLGAELPLLPTQEGIWSEAREAWKCVDADRRSRAFRATFGHTAASAYPPYETHYGQATLFLQADVLADIRGFYRAFGLSPDNRCGELPDHAGAELEFACFLLGKELSARTPEKAAIARDIRAKFLRDHLGKWACAFARLLARNAPAEEYRAVGRLLDAFIAEELADLGLPAADLDRLPQPIPVQAPVPETVPCEEPSE